MKIHAAINSNFAIFFLFLSLRFKVFEDAQMIFAFNFLWSDI